MPLLFSRLPMFPFFDLAHYMASVMALKEQRGAERSGEALGGGQRPGSRSRPGASVPHTASLPYLFPSLRGGERLSKFAAGRRRKL